MSILNDLFGPPKIENLLAKKDFKGLVTAASHNDKERQLKAFNALSELGDPSIKYLVLCLKTYKDTKLINAITLLEKLGWKPQNTEQYLYYYIAFSQWGEIVKLGSGVLPTLIEILSDRNETIRTRMLISFAMAIIGGDKKCAKAIINFFSSATFSIETSLAWQALISMKENAVTFLIPILRNKNTDQMLKVDSAEMLAWLGKPALQPLLDMLNSLTESEQNDQMLVMGIVLSLLSSGDNRAIEAVTQFNLKVTDIELRNNLRRYANIFKSPPLTIIDATSNSDGFVCKIAANALGNLKEKSGIKALNTLLETGEDSLKMTALVNLCKIGDTATDYLVEKLSLEDDTIYILITVIALIDINSPSFLNALTQLLKKDSLNKTARAVAEMTIEHINKTIS